MLQGNIKICTLGQPLTSDFALTTRELQTTFTSLKDIDLGWHVGARRGEGWGYYFTTLDALSILIVIGLAPKIQQWLHTGARRFPIRQLLKNHTP